MLKKLHAIYEGWKNVIFENPEIEKIARLRATHCADCPLNVDEICSKVKEGQAVKTFQYKNGTRVEGRYYNGCGCPLEAKLRSNTEDNKCPLGSWEHIELDK